MLQLGQRPLTGSAADRVLFVNRIAELGHLKRSADLGFNVLVLGERGMGVTSLVLQHQRCLEEADRSGYYVTAGRVEDIVGLVAAVRVVVAGKYTVSPLSAGLQQVVAATDPVPAVLREMRAMSAEVSQSGGRRPIVILDDLRDVGLVHELFGRYRDETWEMPLRWVVCGLATRRSQYLEPPADAFFDSVLTVAPLDSTTSRSLLQARLAQADIGDSGVAERIMIHESEIVERGEGNPRRLLAAVRSAVLRSPEEAVDADRLMSSAAELGGTEKVAVRHLLRHGPTSASDPGLLERLEVSRARATQVLRRLEDAELVYAFHDKRGVGRPRKLYATRLSHEETA